MVSGNSSTGQFHQALFKVRLSVALRHIGVRYRSHCGRKPTQDLGQSQTFATIGRYLRRFQRATHGCGPIDILVEAPRRVDWINAVWHGRIYLVNT
jgi:hypothetical protein